MYDDFKNGFFAMQGNPGGDPELVLNQPFKYTENFLQKLANWEASIPMKFLWVVYIDNIPAYVTSQTMWDLEPGGSGQHASGGSQKPDWNIDRGKQSITKAEYMNTANKHGCILAQGVVLPGDQFNTEELAINNNMGFLPGKIAGNRSGPTELTVQFRETNRSLPDLVLRPWIQIASHMGFAARPDRDRNIKSNIHVVQLAKTAQHAGLIERKIWHFYNCVPVGIDGAELTYDGNEVKLYSVRWQYTHYGIESLPNDTIETEYFDSVRSSNTSSYKGLRGFINKQRTTDTFRHSRWIESMSRKNNYIEGLKQKTDVINHVTKGFSSNNYKRPSTKSNREGDPLSSKNYKIPETTSGRTNERRSSKSFKIPSTDINKTRPPVTTKSLRHPGFQNSMSRKNERIDKLMAPIRRIKQQLDVKSRVRRRINRLLD